ncbi:MAG: hypothetical protein ACXQTY_04875 [Candidatus Methanogasteraceae archaeon]
MHGERGIGIVHAITDDPRLAERPMLTIVIDRQMPDDPVGELLKCEGVRGGGVC